MYSHIVPDALLDPELYKAVPPPIRARVQEEVRAWDAASRLRVSGKSLIPAEKLSAAAVLEKLSETRAGLQSVSSSATQAGMKSGHALRLAKLGSGAAVAVAAVAAVTLATSQASAGEPAAATQAGRDDSMDTGLEAPGDGDLPATTDW